MTHTWQTTDIPTARLDHMSRLFDLLIAAERGLALLHGIDKDDRSALENAFMQDYSGPHDQARAALIRFDALVDVFTAKRLREMLLENGIELIEKSFAIAATMRLNAEWGFNPNKFVWVLRGRISQPSIAAKHPYRKTIAQLQIAGAAPPSVNTIISRPSSPAREWARSSSIATARQAPRGTAPATEPMSLPALASS